jgi:hypothetical protein
LDSLLWSDERVAELSGYGIFELLGAGYAQAADAPAFGAVAGNAAEHNVGVVRASELVEACALGFFSSQA